jgi:hypothetical protein
MRGAAVTWVALLVACGDNASTFRFEVTIDRGSPGETIAIDGDPLFGHGSWTFASYAEARASLVLAVSVSDGSTNVSSEVRPGFCVRQRLAPSLEEFGELTAEIVTLWTNSNGTLSAAEGDCVGTETSFGWGW